MIPKSWDKDRLRNELYKLDAELRENDIALSMCPCGSWGTAVLEFKHADTAFFRNLPIDEDYNVLDSPLVIDQNFFGFTVLHSPKGKISAE